MNSKYEGPFITSFESDIEGIIKQELITYRVKDGMLRKEVTTREYTAGGKDWNDTSTVSPLAKVEV
jgi:hypothetical protein